MALFVVSHDSPLTPAAAWERITDWRRHGDYVPLTRISVTTPGPNGVGTTFVARTGTTRAGFDDPMTITQWQPPAGAAPGRCRLEKQGRVALGWAEITVEATVGGGSRSTWREDVSIARVPKFADGLTALSSRLLFGRVLRKLLTD